MRQAFSRSERWFPLAEIAERTVSHAFLASARRRPDHLAIIDDDERLTYRQLDESVGRVARGLRDLGVERGSLVITMMDNHVDNVVVWLALTYLGAVSVPVNVAYTGDALTYMFAHSEVPFAVVDEAYLAEALEADAAAGATVQKFVVRTPYDRDSANAEPGERYATIGALRSSELTCEPVDLAPWDLHSVMYTSGTTSRPKGTLIPHALTYTRAAIYQTAADVDRRVEMCTLPLFHVVGQCRGVLGPLMLGGTSVIRSRFSASRFWDDCRRFGVTDAGLMGAMAQFLLAQPASERDKEHQVRCIHAAGAELSKFGERFGVAVVTAYGMTEIGSITHGDSPNPGSIGYVHHQVEYEVVDDHDVPTAPGVSGELIVRPTLPWTFTSGYLRDANATTELWRNLWLHTGDVVREQPDGELYFIGRKKFVIRRRGENISPAEVEDVLLQYPGVLEAAAVGVPSSDGEEEVLGLVVGRETVPIDFAAMLEFLVGRLAYFKVPRYLEVRRGLPKTPTHKIDIGALRAGASVDSAWDREAAGFHVTRAGLVRR